MRQVHFSQHGCFKQRSYTGANGSGARLDTSPPSTCSTNPHQTTHNNCNNRGSPRNAGQDDREVRKSKKLKENGYRVGWEWQGFPPREPLQIICNTHVNCAKQQPAQRTTGISDPTTASSWNTTLAVQQQRSPGGEVALLLLLMLLCAQASL